MATTSEDIKLGSYAVTGCLVSSVPSMSDLSIPGPDLVSSLALSLPPAPPPASEHFVAPFALALASVKRNICTPCLDTSYVLITNSVFDHRFLSKEADESFSICRRLLPANNDILILTTCCPHTTQLFCKRWGGAGVGFTYARGSDLNR